MPLCLKLHRRWGNSSRILSDLQYIPRQNTTNGFFVTIPNWKHHMTKERIEAERKQTYVTDKDIFLLRDCRFEWNLQNNFSNVPWHSYHWLIKEKCHDEGEETDDSSVTSVSSNRSKIIMMVGSEKLDKGWKGESDQSWKRMNTETEALSCVGEQNQCLGWDARDGAWSYGTFFSLLLPSL